MNKFKAWLSTHSITAHTIAALFVSASAAYAEVPQFHALINNLYAYMPSSAKEIILTIVPLYAWYRNNQTRKGSVDAIVADDKATEQKVLAETPVTPVASGEIN